MAKGKSKRSYSSSRDAILLKTVESDGSLSVSGKKLLHLLTGVKNTHTTVNTNEIPQGQSLRLKLKI